MTTTRRPGHRYRTRKAIVASTGVSATLLACLACLAFGLPAAHAADPGNQPGTEATFGPWIFSGYTDRQTDPNPPTDPDGQDGEDNLANVVQIGERHQEWVAGGTTLESSGWVTSPPQGEGWAMVSQRTVTDVEATETIVVDEEAHWQRYSWTGGPHAGDDPPAFPSSSWQPNVQGDPHGVGVEGAYFRSNGGSGKGSWFYLEWVEARTHVEQVEAVVHTEYLFERNVDLPGHTEYYWSVYERTTTPGEPLVEEENPPNEPNEPNEPTQPTQLTHTDVRDAQSGHGTRGEQDRALASTKSARPDRPGARARIVPLSIDAGL